MRSDAELLHIYNLWVVAHSDEYDRLSVEERDRIFNLLKGGEV